MSIRYTALLNTPYSGSTLVSMLLCSQPRVVGFGDTYVIPNPRHYPKHPCTCGEWYDDCPPRVAIRDTARAGGIPDYNWDTVTAAPVPRWLPWQLRQRWPLAKTIGLPIVRAIPGSLRRSLYRRFYLENRLMVEGLESTGQYDVYFDGCKDLVRLELLLDEMPDIRLLHMIRHPGAFFYHFHKLGGTDFERRFSQWQRYNQRAAEFAERVPAENYRAITYEAIVRDPETFVADMATFMGMSETNDDRARIYRDRIHVMGNRMRESADRVLDYSQTWRGKMAPEIEARADAIVDADPWLKSLFAE